MHLTLVGLLHTDNSFSASDIMEANIVEVHYVKFAESKGHIVAHTAIPNREVQGFTGKSL